MHATESIQGTVRQTRWGRDSRPRVNFLRSGGANRFKGAVTDNVKANSEF